VIPTVDELVKFFQFAGPMFVISLARGVSWNITTPAAAMAGTVALAAHQVVLNVFFFFTIAGEAVFQTAQAFMPEFQQHPERVKANSLTRSWSRRLMNAFRSLPKRSSLLPLLLAVYKWS